MFARQYRRFRIANLLASTGATGVAQGADVGSPLDAAVADGDAAEFNRLLHEEWQARQGK